jgi:hypothetical protein
MFINFRLKIVDTECYHGYKLNFISLKLPENTGIKLDFGQEVDFAGSTPLI